METMSADPRGGWHQLYTNMKFVILIAQSCAAARCHAGICRLRSPSWRNFHHYSTYEILINYNGSTRKRMGDFCMIRERWQKMRNDLHGQVLFIAEAVGLT